MPLFRRSNVYDPEKEGNGSVNVTGDVSEESIPTYTDGEVTYARLITAQDNSETAVIESILRSAAIPYVIREGNRESWARVIMGYNTFGYDFYVPRDLLDDAAALLVPEDDEKSDGTETDGQSDA